MFTLKLAHLRFLFSFALCNRQGTFTFRCQYGVFFFLILAEFRRSASIRFYNSGTFSLICRDSTIGKKELRRKTVVVFVEEKFLFLLLKKKNCYFRCRRSYIQCTRIRFIQHIGSCICNNDNFPIKILLL